MSVARIDARFAKLRDENRAAFVAYVMAGDPDPQQAFEILRGLPGAGADLIELGFPFSDPMAEGPPIQRAALRSLKHGTTLADTLATVARFRGQQSPPLLPANAGIQAFSLPAVGTDIQGEKNLDPRVRWDERTQGDHDTPVILMGYLNPVLSYGFERFAADAAAAGVDGLIIVDCPPEEADPLADALDAHGIALIRLATPTTDARRLPAVLRRTSGFVYYVSVSGVTGVREADADAVAPAVARVRAASGLPVAVGFGIRTPERAAAIARVADAAVVGSALVEEVATALAANQPAAHRVLAKASELAKAVRQARS